MPEYRYDEDGAFIIEGYDEAPAFMSFLPGLAGEAGVPMWLYYANRGQGVCSFGVENKDQAIMEFSPANTALKRVASEGFRTFVSTADGLYEPFSPSGKAHRTMRIDPNSFLIEETDARRGFRFTVRYFTLPGEDFAGLMRCCELTNTGNGTAECAALDGMPQIIPYGVTTGMYKAVSNLSKSWAHVSGLHTGVPFFHTRSLPGDEAEVKEARGGFFYLSFQKDGAPVCPVINPALYFDEAFTRPVSFPESADAEQIFTNRYACAFTPLRAALPPGGTCKWYSLIGFSQDPDSLWRRAPSLCDAAWAESKYREAMRLTDRLTASAASRTAEPLLDGYVRQCYLDNVLRGGEPRLLGDKTVHLYSRKHGDPERDYNFFTLSAEYFSQGNGGFRDVCQNRRSDVFFRPEAGEPNIRLFFSLIQADGFNPLDVRGVTFSPGEDGAFERRIRQCPAPQKLSVLARKPFTAGALARALCEDCGVPKDALAAVLGEWLTDCVQHINAAFGEGYWIDHWTYLMDLIDHYLAVFPERKAELLQSGGYRFFRSPIRVLPRREAYVPYKGTLRQYRALERAEGLEENGWLHNADGSFAETTLLGKMAVLALVKFASLDPLGRALEMDGGKPGWNDAMNGLPGLFGSGVGEAYELKRLLAFLKEAPYDETLILPEEAAELFAALVRAQSIQDAFAYWDATASAKEAYRQRVSDTLTGRVTAIAGHQWCEALARFAARLDKGLAEAETMADLVPTYLTYEPTGLDATGFPTGFACRPLPAFLEGPARQMRITPEKAEAIHRAVRSCELYDTKLGMYKTSVSLDSEPYDIGRVRAFTPGWLEREAVFLHMALKYLLALLRAGLYDAFYEDMRKGLPAFMDPSVYGRNPMENATFIASGVNPDPAVAGRGFVARLSGSTAEMLSIWLTMFLGEKPFSVLQDGTLRLTLAPALSGQLFPEDGEVWFMLFSSVKILYKNPLRKNTYGPDGVKPGRIETLLTDGTVIKSDNGCLDGEAALAVREGRAVKVTVSLELSAPS